MRTFFIRRGVFLYVLLELFIFLLGCCQSFEIERALNFLHARQSVCYHVVLPGNVADIGGELSDEVQVSELPR